MSKYNSDDEEAEATAEILAMARADIDSGRTREGAEYDVEAWCVPEYLDSPPDLAAAHAALGAAGYRHWTPEDPPEDENYVLVTVLPRVVNTPETVLAALRALDALLAPAEVVTKAWTLRPPAPRTGEELLARWSFEGQRNRTAWTRDRILRRAPRRKGAPLTLDLQFDPLLPGADYDGLIAALRAEGLEAARIEGEAGDWIEASAPDTPFTVDAIWALERRASELALLHGFQPDGWGVMLPPLGGLAGLEERARSWLDVIFGGGRRMPLD
ncbi:hypothetical protein ACQ5SO_08120 [Rhodovulum sp. DZ06]|uniref:hypothetical protein n=1 Tax=Rhodovulum sp. DZ06 TaxID=3425126 RepID=UPI003D33FBAA